MLYLITTEIIISVAALVLGIASIASAAYLGRVSGGDGRAIRSGCGTSMQRRLTMSDKRAENAEALNALLARLEITEAALAHDLGASPKALMKGERANSRVAQNRLRDLAEILQRTTPWAGSVSQAYAWFNVQPLPSFGDRTAAELLRAGRVEAVKFYLARLEVGGYA